MVTEDQILEISKILRFYVKSDFLNCYKRNETDFGFKYSNTTIIEVWFHGKYWSNNKYNRYGHQVSLVLDIRVNADSYNNRIREAVNNLLEDFNK